MKKLLLGLGVFLSTILPVQAHPIIGYVQISTGGTQSGGFNTQTGTVGTLTAGSITDTGLAPNQCLQTTSGGLITTSGTGPCSTGSGGGSSSGTVTVVGTVIISSPSTPVLKFISNDFIGALNGSSSTIALNPATTNYIHNSTSLQSGAFNVSTGTASSMTVVGLNASTITINIGSNNIIYSSTGVLSGSDNFTFNGSTLVANGRQVFIKNQGTTPTSGQFILLNTNFSGAYYNTIGFDVSTSTNPSGFAANWGIQQFGSPGFTLPTMGYWDSLGNWVGGFDAGSSTTGFEIGTSLGRNKLDIAGNAMIGSNFTVTGAHTCGFSSNQDCGAFAPTNGLAVEGNVIIGTTTATTGSSEFQVTGSTANKFLAYFSTTTSGGNRIVISTNTEFVINGSTGTSGQVFTSSGPGFPPYWGPVSASGGSALSVATGTSSGFTTPNSTSTTIINLNSSQFSSILAGGTTVFISLLSTQTFSSMTVTGPITSGSTVTASALSLTGGDWPVFTRTADSIDYRLNATSSTVTVGHAAVYSSTSGATVDGGVVGGAPGGSSGQIQYNNAGSFAGSTNTFVTASSITFISSVTINTGGGGGTTANNPPGLLDVFSGNNMSHVGQPLLVLGSKDLQNQVVFPEHQAIDAHNYGIDAGALQVGDITFGTSKILSNQSSNSFIDFFDSNSGFTFQTGAAALRDFVFNPQTVSTVRISSNGVTIYSTITVTGVTNGGNASAGIIGEYISSSAVTAAAFPASGNFGDLVSMSLTAGDWDVTAVLGSQANSATVTTMSIGISSTTGNSSAGLVEGDSLIKGLGPTAATDTGVTVPNLRVSLTGTKTYYLKYSAGFSVATPNAVGRLSARRVR